jgi:NADPH:quinone reductase-like Zn-dependent oxidoreductase
MHTIPPRLNLCFGYASDNTTDTHRHALRELHVFRGHQPSPTGFIMGHEFVGTVVEAGSAVTTVAVGDKVVAPFTVSW